MTAPDSEPTQPQQPAVHVGKTGEEILVILAVIFRILVLVGGICGILHGWEAYNSYNYLASQNIDLGGESSWKLWTSVMVFEIMSNIYLTTFVVCAAVSAIFHIRKKLHYWMSAILCVFPIAIIYWLGFFENLRASI